MGVNYSGVLWNGFKKKYDILLLSFVGIILLSFFGLQISIYPGATLETVIIRGTALTAFLLLHIILLIGPLCRLDKRFLPLLYNRRHLGVTMFLIAFIHGLFCLIQYHSLGDVSIIESLFSSNSRYAEISRFPFQVLGFMALVILFFMAITSHDFWLKNLGPGMWKCLHMGVYIAYALIVFHVLFGTLEYESHIFYKIILYIGVIIISGLHGYTGYIEWKKIQAHKYLSDKGFYDVVQADNLEEGKGISVNINGEDIALFCHENAVSAVSNICKHQLGPLSEGQIIDGCITCPWHGYQYFPHNGQSPPPFKEKIKTYQVIINNGRVWVNPEGLPEGSLVEPVKI